MFFSIMRQKVYFIIEFNWRHPDLLINTYIVSPWHVQWLHSSFREVMLVKSLNTNSLNRSGGWYYRVDL